ncbi:ABC transporter substrate-binding protein [Paenibacillus alkaliterrae]|uniref:ABC transporter substrate-binding protein n=1 Tax=Paenibacillus alkaliterrae TaxID=320909 RepID=UPI001F44A7E9|nr:ABC transporter substrate-binding protein [Paenibacillus alkaliterrae]MCF2939520.1 ABC transporter substrate-binding protein [Paenibacillus alkaliterrae]
MKKKFGWLSAILALMILIAACGTNSGSDNTAEKASESNESGEVSEAPYEVVYAFPIFQSVPKDLNLVQDEINKISKAKINVTVKLLPISISAWTNQINLMMTSGEKLDMLAHFDYSTQVSKGKLYPIGDIMEQYGKGIIDALGQDYYNATKINGKSYGVPSIRDLAQDYGYIIRKDLVEKHNIDLSQVKTYEDYEKIFSVIKAKEPNMVGVTNMSGNSVLGTYSTRDSLGDDFGVLLNNGQTDFEIVNWFATDEYAQQLKTIRKWYQAGYILKDAAQNQEATQAIIKAGKAAGNFSHMKPGFEAQESRGIGMKVVAVRTAPAVAKTSTVTNVMLGVSSNAEKPEKVLQFLNLMYTDKDIVNLFDWGIEGKHYVKMEGQDNMIKYPDGVDGDNVGYFGYGWMHGNQFLSQVFEGDDPEVFIKQAEFNKTAVKSKALGFTFNSEPVKTEVAAATGVLQQFRRGLESGVLDVDKELPKFIAKLKDAGIDKIMEEKQKQLDEWAKANGN